MYNWTVVLPFLCGKLGFYVHTEVIYKNCTGNCIRADQFHYIINEKLKRYILFKKAYINNFYKF